MRVVQEWGDLHSAVRAFEPQIAIIGTLAGVAAELDGHLLRLRREYVHLMLVGFGPIEPSAVRQLLVMARHGVERVILDGVDPLVASLEALVAGSSMHEFETLVMSHVLASLGRAATPFARWALSGVSARLTVLELAKRAGVNRSTIVRWAQEARIPHPSRFFGWVRLLFALYSFDRRFATLEQTALACGFGSSTALKQMTRRYLNVPPGDLERGTAFAYAGGVFRSWLDYAAGGSEKSERRTVEEVIVSRSELVY